MGVFFLKRKGERFVKEMLQKGMIPQIPTFLIMGGWVIQPWGWIGNLICFFGTAISLTLGIYIGQKKCLQAFAIQEAEQTRGLLRRQRHDWLNHLQVLSGYHVMKRSDKLLQYLQKLAQDAGREREISSLSYAPLAVFLLTLSVKYKEWAWHVQLDHLPKLEDESIAKQIHQLLKQTMDWLQKQGEEYLDWTQISQEKENVCIYWKLLDEDGKVLPLDFPHKEWEILRKRMDQQGVKVAAIDEDQTLLLRYVS
jgi:uncharacterized protein YihD (DUF1040 family)